MAKYTQYLELRYNSKKDKSSEFVNETKDKLYRSIFKVFIDLHQSNRKEGRVIVHTSINGDTSEKIFNISTSDTSLLEDEILLHFSEKEEFENCTKILRMCKDLKKH